MLVVRLDCKQHSTRSKEFFSCYIIILDFFSFLDIRAFGEDLV